DDVDAVLLHLADRQERRVVLRLFEPGLRDAPDLTREDARGQARAEHVAIDEPVRPREASDDGRRKELRHHLGDDALARSPTDAGPGPRRAPSGPSHRASGTPANWRPRSPSR